MAAEHTAVTVRRILAHAYICDDIQLVPVFFLDSAQRLLNDAVLIPCTASHLILVIRNAKQHDAIYACIKQCIELTLHAIEAVAVLARHRRNLLCRHISLFYKHRVNEGGRIHPRLPHHLPKPCSVS